MTVFTSYDTAIRTITGLTDGPVCVLINEPIAIDGRFARGVFVIDKSMARSAHNRAWRTGNLPAWVESKVCA